MSTNRFAHEDQNATTFLSGEEGTLRLAGRSWDYAVIRPTEGSDAPPTMLLVGTRGDRYYLRPFLGQQAGLYEIVSLRHGGKLRDRGQRIVQVIWLGDVLQEVVA